MNPDPSTRGCLAEAGRILLGWLALMVLLSVAAVWNSGYRRDSPFGRFVEAVRGRGW